MNNELSLLNEIDDFRVLTRKHKNSEENEN